MHNGEKLYNALNALIDISNDTYKALVETNQATYMSKMSVLKEFRTVGTRSSRRSGKDYTIAKTISRFNDVLIVVPTKEQGYILEREIALHKPTCNFKIVSEKSDWNRTATLGVDAVFINNYILVSNHTIDAIYDMIAHGAASVDKMPMLIMMG